MESSFCRVSHRRDAILAERKEKKTVQRALTARTPLIVIYLFVYLFPFQASVQRVHGPALPGPLASGELAAAAHPGTGHPELFDPLQPHLARLRDPGAVRGRHGPPELSDRGDQSHGQNVPQQQPQQSLRQRQ